MDDSGFDSDPKHRPSQEDDRLFPASDSSTSSNTLNNSSPKKMSRKQLHMKLEKRIEQAKKLQAHNDSKRSPQLIPIQRLPIPTSKSPTSPREHHPLVDWETDDRIYDRGPPAAVRLNTTIQNNPNEPNASIGPVSAELDEMSEQVTQQIKSLFQEKLDEVSSTTESLEAEIAELLAKKEMLFVRHRQEMAEIKRNGDLQIMKDRERSDADKQNILIELKRRHDLEKEQAVKQAKRTQWCNSCPNEGELHCCWNTSYCSLTCQKLDWTNHQLSCKNHQREENATVAGANV